MSSKRPPWLAEDERKWDHITVHERVLRHPSLTIYDRGVYCVLAWHANAGTGDSRPGQPTIADEAGCSERQVRKSLGALEATRLIDIVREAGKPTVYRLLPPPKAPVLLPPKGDPPRHTVPDYVEVGTAPCAVVQKGDRHTVPAEPAPDAKTPRHTVPHNKKEALNENQERKRVLPSAKNQTAQPDQPSFAELESHPDLAEKLANLRAIAQATAPKREADRAARRARQ